MQRLSLKEGTSNPLRDDGHYSGDEGDEHHSEESGGTSHTFFELDQTTANAFDDGDEEENCGSAARRRSAAQNFLACSLLLVVAVILAVLVTHAVDATGNKTELPVDDASSDDADTGPLKILFVGNSFTYGPPPYDREDQHSLNNLPAMFKLVSESMGRAVLTAEDTLGGCTVYTHRPSRNPEACDVEVGSNGDDDDDDNKCQLIDTYRVGANRYCSAPEGISCDSDSCESSVSARRPFILLRHVNLSVSISYRLSNRSYVPAALEPAAIWPMGRGSYPGSLRSAYGPGRTRPDAPTRLRRVPADLGPPGNVAPGGRRRRRRNKRWVATPADRKLHDLVVLQRHERRALSGWEEKGLLSFRDPRAIVRLRCGRHLVSKDRFDALPGVRFGEGLCFTRLLGRLFFSFEYRRQRRQQLRRRVDTGRPGLADGARLAGHSRGVPSPGGRRIRG